MGVIAMTKFGSYGRFGNQVIEYMFLKVYAKRYGLEVQIPRWVGNYLFGTNDPPPNGKYPVVREKDNHDIHDTVIPHSPPLSDVDVEGYFQYHTSWYAPDKEYIWDLFKVAPEPLLRVAPILDGLDTRGRTKIGLHIRRGDYGRMAFPIIPVEWYIRWLQEYWDMFDNPVLSIATEDASLVQSFAPWNPCTVETFGVELRARPMPTSTNLGYDIKHGEARPLDFFPDWYILSQCDVVVMPNSTYPYSAAMAGGRCEQAYRCDLKVEKIMPIELWHDFPMRFDFNQKNYPNVPGLWLTDSPYWKF